MMLQLRCWYLALLHLVLVECKFQSGTVRLGGFDAKNQWKYLSKFGFGIGEGTYEVRLKYARTPPAETPRRSLTMDVFLDEDWAEVEMLEPCSKARKSRAVRHLELEPSGEWGEWQKGAVFQTVRAHVWYFALSACGNELQNMTQRIQFEAHFLQENGSEFSVELSGMLTFHFLYFLGFTACLVKYASHCRAFIRSADTLHPIIWVLTAALFLQYIGEFLRLDHLWGYRSNGSGMRFLDVIAEVLFTFSQVIISSLLITIGLGYTLVQSKLGDLDLMVPLVFLIAMIHVVLVGIGKSKDDSSTKFHENEGLVGWIVAFIRLSLYVWFVWAVRSTAKEGGLRLQLFLRKFLVAGSVYFLSFPVLFMIIGIFAPYIQHKIMAAGLLLVQTCTSIWLAHLLLSRGEYFKVSTLSASFLPGGVKAGLTKEE